MVADVIGLFEVPNTGTSFGPTSLCSLQLRWVKVHCVQRCPKPGRLQPALDFASVRCLDSSEDTTRNHISIVGQGLQILRTVKGPSINGGPKKGLQYVITPPTLNGEP